MEDSPHRRSGFVPTGTIRGAAPAALVKVRLPDLRAIAAEVASGGMRSTAKVPTAANAAAPYSTGMSHTVAAAAPRATTATASSLSPPLPLSGAAATGSEYTPTPPRGASPTRSLPASRPSDRIGSNYSAVPTPSPHAFAGHLDDPAVLPGLPGSASARRVLKYGGLFRSLPGSLVADAHREAVAAAHQKQAVLARTAMARSQALPTHGVAGSGAGEEAADATGASAAADAAATAAAAIALDTGDLPLWMFDDTTWETAAPQAWLAEGLPRVHVYLTEEPFSASSGGDASDPASGVTTPARSPSPSPSPTPPSEGAVYGTTPSSSAGLTGVPLAAAIMARDGAAHLQLPESIRRARAAQSGRLWRHLRGAAEVARAAAAATKTLVGPLAFSPVYDGSAWVWVPVAVTAWDGESERYQIVFLSHTGTALAAEERGDALAAVAAGATSRSARKASKRSGASTSTSMSRFESHNAEVAADDAALADAAAAASRAADQFAAYWEPPAAASAAFAGAAATSYASSASAASLRQHDIHMTAPTFAGDKWVRRLHLRFAAEPVAAFLQRRDAAARARDKAQAAMRWRIAMQRHDVRAAPTGLALTSAAGMLAAASAPGASFSSASLPRYDGSVGVGAPMTVSDILASADGSSTDGLPAAASRGRGGRGAGAAGHAEGRLAVLASTAAAAASHGPEPLPEVLEEAIVDRAVRLADVGPVRAYYSPTIRRVMAEAALAFTQAQRLAVELYRLMESRALAAHLRAGLPPPAQPSAAPPPQFGQVRVSATGDRIPYRRARALLNDNLTVVSAPLQGPLAGTFGAFHASFESLGRVFVDDRLPVGATLRGRTPEDLEREEERRRKRVRSRLLRTIRRKAGKAASQALRSEGGTPAGSAPASGIASLAASAAASPAGSPGASSPATGRTPAGSPEPSPRSSLLPGSAGGMGLGGLGSAPTTPGAAPGTAAAATGDTDASYPCTLEQWQRRHADACGELAEDISEELRTRLVGDLHESITRAGGPNSAALYARSAAELVGSPLRPMLVKVRLALGQMVRQLADNSIDSLVRLLLWPSEALAVRLADLCRRQAAAAAAVASAAAGGHGGRLLDDASAALTDITAAPTSATDAWALLLDSVGAEGLPPSGLSGPALMRLLSPPPKQVASGSRRKRSPPSRRFGGTGSGAATPARSKSPPSKGSGSSAGKGAASGSSSAARSRTSRHSDGSGDEGGHGDLQHLTPMQALQVHQRAAALRHGLIISPMPAAMLASLRVPDLYALRLLHDRDGGETGAGAAASGSDAAGGDADDTDGTIGTVARLLHDKTELERQQRGRALRLPPCSVVATPEQAVQLLYEAAGDLLIRTGEVTAPMLLHMDADADAATQRVVQAIENTAAHVDDTLAEVFLGFGQPAAMEALLQRPALFTVQLTLQSAAAAVVEVTRARLADTTGTGHGLQRQTQAALRQPPFGFDGVDDTDSGDADLVQMQPSAAELTSALTNTLDLITEAASLPTTIDGQLLGLATAELPNLPLLPLQQAASSLESGAHADEAITTCASTLIRLVRARAIMSHLVPAEMARPAALAARFAAFAWVARLTPADVMASVSVRRRYAALDGVSFVAFASHEDAKATFDAAAAAAAAAEAAAAVRARLNAAAEAQAAAASSPMMAGSSGSVSTPSSPVLGGRRGRGFSLTASPLITSALPSAQAQTGDRSPVLLADVTGIAATPLALTAPASPTRSAARTFGGFHGVAASGSGASLPSAAGAGGYGSTLSLASVAGGPGTVHLEEVALDSRDIRPAEPGAGLQVAGEWRVLTASQWGDAKAIVASGAATAANDASAAAQKAASAAASAAAAAAAARGRGRPTRSGQSPEQDAVTVAAAVAATHAAQLAGALKLVVEDDAVDGGLYEPQPQGATQPAGASAQGAAAGASAAVKRKMPRTLSVGDGSEIIDGPGPATLMSPTTAARRAALPADVDPSSTIGAALLTNAALGLPAPRPRKRVPDELALVRRYWLVATAVERVADDSVKFGIVAVESAPAKRAIADHARSLANAVIDAIIADCGSTIKRVVAKFAHIMRHIGHHPTDTPGLDALRAFLGSMGDIVTSLRAVVAEQEQRIEALAEFDRQVPWNVTASLLAAQLWPARVERAREEATRYLSSLTDRLSRQLAEEKAAFERELAQLPAAVRAFNSVGGARLLETAAQAVKDGASGALGLRRKGSSASMSSSASPEREGEPEEGEGEGEGSDKEGEEGKGDGESGGHGDAAAGAARATSPSRRERQHGAERREPTMSAPAARALIDRTVESSQQLQDRFDASFARLQDFHARERILGLTESEYAVLTEASEEFAPLFSLWNTVGDFNSNRERWLSGTFKSMDSASIQAQVTAWYGEALRLQRLFKEKGLAAPAGAATALRQRIAAFREVVPIIAALASKALKEVHWQEIAELLNESELDSPESLTLQDMLDLGIAAHVDVSVMGCSSAAEQR